MGLVRDGHERVGRRNANYRRARLPQVLVGRAAGVECTHKIDIDHGLESIGRHTQHGRRKIPRCAAHQDVDRAELLPRLAQRVLALFVITHVARNPQGRATRRPYDFRRPVQLILLASHQTHLGALRRKAFGDAQIDSAAAAGDERYFFPQ